MRTKSKSRTTTKPTVRRRNALANGHGVSRRRLPRNRPPTHPGEMLKEEFLVPLGVSQVAFAARIGIPRTRLADIVRGAQGVTPDTALRLERVLGMSAEFWLGLQQDWDLWHAMRGAASKAIARLEPIVRVG